jgi:hypothetical protein
MVLAAEARVVDEMLSAFELDDARVTRRTLSEDELAVIEVGLSDEPAAARSSGRHVDPKRSDVLARGRCAPPSGSKALRV